MSLQGLYEYWVRRAIESLRLAPKESFIPIAGKPNRPGKGRK